MDLVELVLCSFPLVDKHKNKIQQFLGVDDVDLFSKPFLLDGYSVIDLKMLDWEKRELRLALLFC